MSVEEGGVEPPRGRRDFMEQIMETIAAGRGKPLYFMLISARPIAQQFGYGAIQPGQRIRILPLFFELQLIALRLPARRQPGTAAIPARRTWQFLPSVASSDSADTQVDATLRQG
jgi:hypothetical protein